MTLKEYSIMLSMKLYRSPGVWVWFIPDATNIAAFEMITGDKIPNPDAEAAKRKYAEEFLSQLGTVPIDARNQMLKEIMEKMPIELTWG